MRPLLKTRRAAALLAAIAVLAILTVLVSGLGFALGNRRIDSTRRQTRNALLRNGRTCVDMLLARLAQSGQASVAQGGFDLSMGEASQASAPMQISAAYVARSAVAGDACYASPFLAYRQGDTLTTVTISAQRGRLRSGLEQVYLVNATASKRRRVRLSQRLAAGAVEKD